MRARCQAKLAEQVSEIRNGRAAAMDLLSGGRVKLSVNKMKGIILGGLNVIKESDCSF